MENKEAEENAPLLHFPRRNYVRCKSELQFDRIIAKPQSPFESISSFFLFRDTREDISSKIQIAKYREIIANWY